MLISSKDLNNKNPNIKGTNTNIYFLSKDYIAKHFVHCYGPRLKQYQQKYESAHDQKNKISDLIQPIDILETEKSFCGYIEPVVPGTFENELVSFASFLNKHQNDITLEEIVFYILNCNQIVTNAHTCEIINPDMCSEGNVWYNVRSKNVYFTDYQDMQVKNIPANGMSSFIITDPIIQLPKYQQKGIFSPNIDLYILTIRSFIT